MEQCSKKPHTASTETDASHQVPVKDPTRPDQEHKKAIKTYIHMNQLIFNGYERDVMVIMSLSLRFCGHSVSKGSSI